MISLMRCCGESSTSSASGLALGTVLGLAWVAGDIMGRMTVGSKPCCVKRREKRVRAGSSGKRSLIRFSNFTI